MGGFLLAGSMGKYAMACLPLFRHGLRFGTGFFMSRQAGMQHLLLPHTACMLELVPPALTSNARWLGCMVQENHPGQSASQAWDCGPPCIACVSQWLSAPWQLVAHECCQLAHVYTASHLWLVPPFTFNRPRTTQGECACKCGRTVQHTAGGATALRSACKLCCPNPCDQCPLMT